MSTEPLYDANRQPIDAGNLPPAPMHLADLTGKMAYFHQPLSDDKMANVMALQIDFIYPNENDQILQGRVSATYTVSITDEPVEFEAITSGQMDGIASSMETKMRSSFRRFIREVLEKRTQIPKE